MEITEQQKQSLELALGKDKLKKVIPEAYVPQYFDSKIYIYDAGSNIYKLHKLNDTTYTFVDMCNSICYTQGYSSAQDQIDRAYNKCRLKVFDNYREFVIWAFKKLHL